MVEGFSKDRTFNPALEERIEFDINRWGPGKVFQAEKQQEPGLGAWKEEGSEDAGCWGQRF